MFYVEVAVNSIVNSREVVSADQLDPRGLPCQEARLHLDPARTKEPDCTGDGRPGLMRTSSYARTLVMFLSLTRALSKPATLRHPPTLTLSAADRIADAAIEAALALPSAPKICVTVVDAAGATIVSKRMDGARPLIPAIAAAKAESCVGMGMSTRELKEKYAEAKPTQLAAMGDIAGGRFAPFPGGVLCVDESTKDPAGHRVVIGAIGVSGAAADEDEHCAIIAARAIGVSTKPEVSLLK